MNEESQWNNNRSNNMGSNYSMRKNTGYRYSDGKGKSYSPSVSFNYQNGQGRGHDQGYQQHPRRHIDRYKRETINYSENLIKQNDIIIRLLREIRDSLTGTPQSTPEIETHELQDRGTGELIHKDLELKEPAYLPTDDEKNFEPTQKAADDKDKQPAVTETEKDASDSSVQ